MAVFIPYLRSILSAVSDNPFTYGMTANPLLTCFFYLCLLSFSFSDIGRASLCRKNHVINWSGAKILEGEGHRKTRQVKESIWIRKQSTCMNRDGGAYSLPTAYDHLLVTCSTSTSRDHKPDEDRRWRVKRRN